MTTSDSFLQRFWAPLSILKIDLGDNLVWEKLISVLLNFIEEAWEGPEKLKITQGPKKIFIQKRIALKREVLDRRHNREVPLTFYGKFNDALGFLGFGFN